MDGARTATAVDSAAAVRPAHGRRTRGTAAVPLPRGAAKVQCVLPRRRLTGHAGWRLREAGCGSVTGGARTGLPWSRAGGPAQRRDRRWSRRTPAVAPGPPADAYGEVCGSLDAVALISVHQQPAR